MKIVIVGPGAMGLLFAGIFSRQKKKDLQVILLDKDRERAARLSKEGFSVEGIAGNWHVPAQAVCDAKEIDKADLVMICVKSYDTKSAIKSVKPALSEDTMVLTLQNGIGNIEIIQEVAGQDRVIGGITSMGATLLSETKVRFAGKGDTVIGRIDGKIPVQIRAIRELFNAGGMDVRISRDIKGFLWSKLIINAGINPLTAVTRLHNGKLLDFEGTRRLMAQAVSEAVKLAKRKRIKLIYDDPLAKVEAVCEATASNISSMLQDVIKKRQTEIDYINGVIVRQGQELGIQVPVNSLLVDLVKTIEASYKETVA
jgi:2-dehydropantoate 2-reductase